MRKTPVAPSFEKVFSANNAAIVLEQVSGERLPCIYHYHPEYELTYIVSGHGNILAGHGMETFAPGHLALIGPNVPHHYASSGSTDGALDKSLVIKFRADCFGREFLELEEMSAVRHLLQQASQGICLLPEDGEKLESTIINLFQASGPLRISGFVELLHRLTLVPYHLLQQSSSPAVLPKSTDTERINRALAYINRHLNEKISLHQVSKASGLSPVVFGRVFSRVMRMTFSQYVLELRLSNACRMLAETSYTISEICYKSGFSNLSNFNRLFKKARRTTPRGFRHRARETLGK